MLPGEGLLKVSVGKSAQINAEICIFPLPPAPCPVYRQNLAIQSAVNHVGIAMSRRGLPRKCEVPCPNGMTSTP
jgi:hypothetical protein